MSILTFTEYIPAHETPKGRMAPPKVKDAAGTEYAVGKDVHLPLTLHVPYEVIVNTKPNGNYINHYLDSAVLVGETAAVTAPPNITVVRNGVAAVDVQRLIVRQSCLKAAVDLVRYDKASYDKLLQLADRLVDWVYEEQPAGSARRPDAQVIGPH